MAMGLVDTMWSAASARRRSAPWHRQPLFFAIAIIGMGTLLGLDYLVAHALGAGRLEDGRRALVQGLYLAVLVGIVLTGVLLLMHANLDHLGLQPGVARGRAPVLRRAAVEPPAVLLLFTALRRYLQALGQVRPSWSRWSAPT